MENQKYDALKLEKQLCFPLYAASREIIKHYKPLLDEVNLTYTQYIVMLVLWEKQAITSKELGHRLFLDSGTLTPLLKKLEAKGYITRKRSLLDERNLEVVITEEGEAIKEQTLALNATEQIFHTTALTAEETATLYRLLYKILGQEK